MIDSDATENFILIKIIKTHKIFKQRKVSPIEFMIINKKFIFQNNGFIKFEILLIIMKIHKHRERIQFDIMKITEYNVILKIL